MNNKPEDDGLPSPGKKHKDVHMQVYEKKELMHSDQTRCLFQTGYQYIMMTVEVDSYFIECKHRSSNIMIQAYLAVVVQPQKHILENKASISRLPFVNIA